MLCQPAIRYPQPLFFQPLWPKSRDFLPHTATAAAAWPLPPLPRPRALPALPAAPHRLRGRRSTAQGQGPGGRPAVAAVRCGCWVQESDGRAAALTALAQAASDGFGMDVGWWLRIWCYWYLCWSLSHHGFHGMSEETLNTPPGEDFAQMSREGSSSARAKAEELQSPVML